MRVDHPGGGRPQFLCRARYCRYGGRLSAEDAGYLPAQIRLERLSEARAYGWYASEKEGYLETARRIRNFSKPTICAVQGKCIAGALIYAWVCDLIIAADNAVFSDPVVNFGVSGVEWLAHPWDLGARKAKEFLFTADSWNADEAHRLGMVNHVVAAGELEDFVLNMAMKIARNPLSRSSWPRKRSTRRWIFRGRRRPSIRHSPCITCATSRISACSAMAWTRASCLIWQARRRRTNSPGSVAAVSVTERKRCRRSNRNRLRRGRFRPVRRLPAKWPASPARAPAVPPGRPGARRMARCRG